MKMYRQHNRFHARAARQRGVAMVLVIAAVAAASIISLAFIVRQSTVTAMSENLTSHSRARFVAESGLELALAHIRSTEDWRSSLSEGEWVTNHSYGGGTFTVSINDGLDLDGDGTFDGDGDLSDDSTDPFTVTVVGRYEGTIHTVHGAITPTGSPSKTVLFVVPDSTDLSDQDEARKTLFEDWGYTVVPIAASASQASFDSAVVDADVAYITEDVLSSSLNTKLYDAPIGVINEECVLNDEYGFGSGNSRFNATTIEIVDNSHYITAAFAVGDLVLTTESEEFIVVTGTKAPGGRILGEKLNSSDVSLMAIDAGGELYDGEHAAGRRVYMPWGGNSFDVNTLTTDAKTLMRRAVEWASQSAEVGAAMWRWTLDDLSGTTATESISAINGSYENNVTLAQAGVHGTAAYFDGTDDHVEVPHVSGMLLDNGTVSFWFKSSQLSSKRGLFSKDSSGNDNGGHIHIYTDYSTLKVRLQSTSGSDTLSASTSLSADEWYHVAVTFGDGGYNLYLNGNLEDSDSYSGGLGTSSGGTGNEEPIAFGANTWNSGNQTITPLTDFFKGYMDDVRMYNYGLTGLEIRTLYEEGLDEEDTAPQLIVQYDFEEVIYQPELIAHFPLDDDAADGTAVDIIGGMDGTPANGAAMEENEAHLGTATRFDGNNDYILVPHDDKMLLDQGSISFWFRPDNRSATDGLVSKDSSGYDTGGHMHIYMESRRVKVRQQSTGSSYNIQSGQVLQDDTWFHVVYTFGSGGMKLYVDGALVDSDSYAGGLGTSSGGDGNYEPMVFGANTWNSGNLTHTSLNNYFDGVMDDIQIYNRALNADQVLDLYTDQPVRQNTGPGDTVVDTSSYGEPLNLTISDTDDITWIADGGLQIDDEIRIASSGPATKLHTALSATDELTVSVIFKPKYAPPADDSRIVTYGVDSSNVNFCVRQQDSVARIEGRVRTTTSNSEGEPAVTTPDGDLDTSVMHHVILTYDGESVKIYRNGTLEDSEDRTGTFSGWDEDYLLTLANCDESDKPFEGVLYKVQIYDRGLNVFQVEDVFQGNSPGNYTSGEGVAYSLRWMEAQP